MSGHRMDWSKKPVRPKSDLVLRSGLPAWIIRALRDSGVKRLSTLAGMSDEALLIIPGIGRRSVSLIREEIDRLADIRSAPSRRGDNGHNEAR